MTTRAQIVDATRLWLGTPYLHQHSMRGVGADCLGLLMGVYADLYGARPEEPPAYSPSWDEVQKDETMLAAARRHLVEVPSGSPIAGDVVVFRMFPNAVAKHCAIATSEITMIHAHQKASVVEVHMGPWWTRKIAGVFSFPGVI